MNPQPDIPQEKSKEMFLKFMHSIIATKNEYDIFLAGWESYASQQRGCGRWVKESERLPDKEGNYFVMVSGIEHDNDNTEYTNGAYYHFVNTFEGKHFPLLPKHETVLEWLDDQSTCECQQLREALEKIKTVLDSKSFGEKSFSWYKEQLNTIATAALSSDKEIKK